MDTNPIDRSRQQDPDFNGPFKRIEDFYVESASNRDCKTCGAEHGQVVAGLKQLQYKQHQQCIDFQNKSEDINARFERIEDKHQEALRNKVPFKVFSWAMGIAATISVTVLGTIYSYSNDQFDNFSAQYQSANQDMIRQITKIETRLSSDIHNMSNKFDATSEKLSNKVDNMSNRLSKVETHIQTLTEH